MISLQSNYLSFWEHGVTDLNKITRCESSPDCTIIPVLLLITKKKHCQQDLAANETKEGEWNTANTVKDRYYVFNLYQFFATVLACFLPHTLSPTLSCQEKWRTAKSWQEMLRNITHHWQQINRRYLTDWLTVVRQMLTEITCSNSGSLFLPLIWPFPSLLWAHHLNYRLQPRYL